MGLPAVLIIILIGRGTSLPNASEGIELYFATWRTSALQGPKIWQDAFGQIFFSIGVGFGYFTSWTSYCSQHSNAVQDAMIIGFSNSAVEIIAAFSVFGVVGFLGLDPSDSEPLGTFVTGFITYPEALAQMPNWVVSALISLIGCTEFGLQALDAVDTYVNNVALFFVVWCDRFAATSIYRCRDEANQVGWVGYLVYTGGFVAAQILGIGIAYAATPAIGAGVGFGIYGASAIAGTLLSKTPGISAPRFWGNSNILSRFWWVAFYSGNQLSRDLNVVIGVGKNWNVPMIWAPVMKYISGPILAIVLSFAYPNFKNNHMYDPIMIYGFSINHVVVQMIVFGFVIPSWFNWIIPSEKVSLGDKPVAPMETLDSSQDVTHAVTEEGQLGHSNREFEYKK
ncbi:hypothetical protein N0V87_007649 [Didymella glomerata]|uniref:Uncharacterized protein n=1 Tax=Didymella glomerata TaxID=749621 RepID=A0A9W8WUF2_9PLEO|nr:hypothetical protein N0V87_007649 [Didymella glomerata]